MDMPLRSLRSWLLSAALLTVAFGCGATPPSALTAGDAGASTDGGATDGGTGGHAIQTVFVILMENQNWASIYQNTTSAPYINQTLLPQASYARQYFNPPGNHPSLPNYLWLEAGSNLGVSDDSPPSAHHFSTPHLSALLDAAGISWKAYEEDISGTDCPLGDQNLYVPKHDPFVYFDDVTAGNDAGSPVCIDHVRPSGELARDLENDTVPSYVFITPNLCDDMHNSSGCATGDAVKNGDTWLSQQVPMILSSAAYKRGGALFIVWDEASTSDGPIGMIVLSPFAKGGGYFNEVPYTHSSMLRTLEEIFSVRPLLNDAANATDLSDLFAQFP